MLKVECERNTIQYSSNCPSIGDKVSSNKVEFQVSLRLYDTVNANYKQQKIQICIHEVHVFDGITFVCVFGYESNMLKINTYFPSITKDSISSIPVSFILHRCKELLSQSEIIFPYKRK